MGLARPSVCLSVCLYTVLTDHRNNGPESFFFIPLLLHVIHLCAYRDIDEVGRKQ